MGPFYPLKLRQFRWKMLTTVAVCAGLWGAGGFPAEPLAHEVARGVEVYRKAKGIDRVLMEDRQIVGWWFDGRVKKGVEDVIRLSPAMLSRWLGYLEAREKWPPTEIQARWENLRRHLSGKNAFVVRLAAYPKQDLFGGLPEPSSAARDECLRVRFLLTTDGKYLPDQVRNPAPVSVRLAPLPVPPPGEPVPQYAQPLARLATSKQGRDRADVSLDDWYLHVEVGRWLQPEFGGAPRGPSYALPIGDNFSALYWLEAPATFEFGAAKTLEVRVFSARKERVAAFQLP